MMAWVASLIFLHGADHETVVKNTAKLLEQEEHRSNQEGILDPPGPIQVSPSVEGWIAISGAAAWLRNLPKAAETLSLAGGDRAVSCEIFGHCYRLRLGEFSSGKKGHWQCTPQQDWTHELDGPETDAGPETGGLGTDMPLYEDTEFLAYQALRGMNIPPRLITLGTIPLVFPSEPPLLLGTATCLTPQAGEIQKNTMDLYVTPYRGEETPVVPTQMSRDFGLLLFEDRYIEGRPSQETFKRLLMLEESLLQRAQRLQPQAQVGLTITYYAGVYQDQIDALLHAQGRPVLHSNRRNRPPWWQFWRHLGRFS